MASAQSSPPTQSTANLPIVVKDRRRKGFFTIDNALLDRFGAELGPYGLAVYIALARFANQESLCWPSLATIAQRTGMSRRQVIREIDTLQTLSLITVEPQVDATTGEHKANRYILLDATGSDSQSPGSDHQSLGGSASQSPGSDSLAPKQYPKNKNQHRNKTKRTSSAQIRINNNSGGQPVLIPDVVAFSPNFSQVKFDELPQNTTQETAARELTSLSMGALPTPLDPPAPSQTTASALIAVGIAPKVAHRLASHYSRARIEEKLAYLDFLQADQPNKVQNPRGWLRRAIEEDYAAPDGYKSAEERTLEITKAQRDEEERQRIITARDQQEKAERERHQQEATDRLMRLHTLYGTTQQETDLWTEMLTEFKLSMPAASFAKYIAETVMLSLRDGEALIGLPNQSARDWLENRFVAKIQRTLASCLGGQKMTVKFIDLTLADLPLVAAAQQIDRLPFRG